MNTIISLRGVGNSGKTTTIRLLPQMLAAAGYNVVNSNYSPLGGDFLAIYSKNNKLIGITSSGDTHDLVFDNLSTMVNQGCEICLCACRTYDRVPPGTNAAIDSFTAYQRIDIGKTSVATPANEAAANAADAQRLFQEIDSRV